MQCLVDEFEKSLPPMDHPLRKLGVRLTELLDDDHWAECERLLLEGWEHDAAALARAAHAAAPKAAPARWYMVNAVGMATLCANEQDAEQAAADAQAMWPHAGPHRAVQMLEVAAAPAPAAQEDAVDAERYRWLRSCNLAKHPAVRDGFELGDAHLNAAIDATRAAQGESK